MEERGGVKYGRVIFMIVSLVTVDTRRSPAPDGHAVLFVIL